MKRESIPFVELLKVLLLLLLMAETPMSPLT